MNKLIVLFIFLLCGLSSMAFADGVSVHLSQRKVGLNDSFSVTFSSAQNIKDPPDFTPLLTDFDIMSKNQENSISIINGKMSQDLRWNIVLISKREGNLIIPSIQFGEYSSSPQSIEVTGGSFAKKEDAIFLETALSPKDSVYENSLLTYTVRLYCSVKLAQASLSDIAFNDKDAIIERVANDVEYDHYHKNGKHYRVYERKYIICPQHAGELVFSPLVFDGAVLSGNNFFDVQTKMVRLHSDKQAITVKPIPAPFQKNNWLPANDVKLTEEWSASPDKIISGEPITWTLKLTAAGCLGNQIPDFAIDFPIELKHYLDKPEISNQLTFDGFTGTKQVKAALIATQPGKIELPKIDIPWWDLKTGTVRHAELPARTLIIQDNNVAMNTSSNKVDVPTTAPVISSEKAAIQNNSQWFIWLLSISGSMVVLVIGLLCLIYKRYKGKASKPDSLKHFKNDLKKACAEGDAKKAEAALLAWFRIKLPSAKHLNLLAIKNSLNEEFQLAVQDLYKALYSQNTTWNGEALWKAFCAYKPHQEAKGKSKVGEHLLPKLYS